MKTAAGFHLVRIKGALVLLAAENEWNPSLLCSALLCLWILPVLDQSGGDQRSRFVQSDSRCLTRHSVLSAGCPVLEPYQPLSACLYLSFQISLLLLVPGVSHSISSYYPFLCLSSLSSPLLPLPSPCMERQLTASLLSSTVPLFAPSILFSLHSFSGYVNSATTLLTR